MKLVSIFALLMSVIVFGVSSASAMDCKGSMYSKLNDGSIGIQQLRIMEKPLLEGEMTVVSKDGQISFETKRKSDEWIYYTDRSNTDMLFVTGYRNLTSFKYKDMKLDKESFFKYKENSIIGFNIICRM